MSATAFISYSHANDKELDRLRKHLSVLRREGKLREWSDHEVLAGSTIDAEISTNLEQSDVFVALVSADYLNSNYCYEKEFQQALKMQEEGRIRIIPVILEPCDWLASPLSKFLALPKDGHPISEWTNPNNAFLSVVDGLRRVIQDMDAVPGGGTSASAPAPPATARRVRLRQDFDIIQKSDFANRAFETIREYFEKSCLELHDAEGQIRTKFEQMSGTAFTCTVVNRAKRSGGEAHITVHNSKGQRRGMGDISYSYERYAEPGSANGWISVEVDDYNLYLEHHGGSSFYGRREDAKLAPEQVAEIIWNDFVHQAGIEYE